MAEPDRTPMPEARRDPVVVCAHAAIASMMRHAVSPSPENFAIWYGYHAGDNAMVRRVLDTYLSNGRDITEGLLQDIHGRFFDTTQEALALLETSDRLCETTQQVVALVEQAGGDTTRYGCRLGSLTGALAVPGADLPGTLRRIVADTREMAERSAQLGARLESSAQVIAELKGRLDQAQVESLTDVLTGLPNRRALEQAALTLSHEAMAAGRPLALAMVDIDRFKAINDTWGHPVGDAVLRRVATTVQQSLAPGARCGRFGGEEFAVLLPDQGLPAAAAMAERLRRAVAELSFSIRSTGTTLGSVTVSAGIAMHRPAEGWAGLLSRADAALYQAKEGGRNRVVCADAG